MATLPTPTKVAGSHLSVYESYYKLVDPANQGHVGPKEAADFLKKSQLSETLLIKIWDMADPHSRGFLDKAGMIVALKLCALAQQGHDLTIANIYMDIPPPRMGDASSLSSFWTITPQEREKYQLLFQSLEPAGGYVSGNKVKGILMDSKLPLETLGKIWDLADMDRDGRLNRHEFYVAMHLVCKAVQKHPIPNALPIELMDSSRTLLTDPSPAVPPVVTAPPPQLISGFSPEKEQPKIDWIVSMDDQKAADKLFVQADKDLDGFVSGAEIKDIFIQSGLPQAILAHIWGLCDIAQSGKLNNEQFALSMWLIKQKLSNKELPGKLTPEMIPPSFRKKGSAAESNKENNNVCSYANPELDMIHKDIIEMVREKQTLEQDISQKEADIKIKSGEIKSLQSELDTLAATLRQLDSQKGEAQKRLNDLKAQVDKLRQQAEDQESTLRVQEDELSTKRQEIESLRMTEQSLETQQSEFKNKLNSLSNDLQTTQLRISQTKAAMTQLEENQHQILDAITQYDGAINSGDISNVPETLYYLKIDWSAFGNFDTAKNDNDEANKENKDIFNNNQEAKDANFAAFGDNFDDGQQQHRAIDDPFKSAEPFAKDPFNDKSYDPFNDGASPKATSGDAAQVKDPFGEDPFAALHAPVRSESSSPALPSKKTKQPPPRPAPPKSARNTPPLGASSIMNTSDPFADKTSAAGTPAATTGGDAFGFADFANFDGK